MKEQDLIDLGFKKNDVTAQESGEPNDWYYYVYEFTGGLSLLSHSNDEVQNNNWTVEFLETQDTIRFEYPKKLKQLITIIEEAIIK